MPPIKNDLGQWPVVIDDLVQIELLTHDDTEKLRELSWEEEITHKPGGATNKEGPF